MPTALAAPPVDSEPLGDATAPPASLKPAAPKRMDRTRLSGLFGPEDQFYASLGDAAPRVREQLNALPNASIERQRIANTAFLADRLNLPAAEVARRYDTLRNSYAKQRFPDRLKDGVMDEGVFFTNASRELADEQQNLSTLGRWNRILFESAMDGKDFATAFDTVRGTGELPSRLTDVGNAWAAQRWEANQTAAARLRPVVQSAADFLSATRTKQGIGTEEYAAQRESVIDQLSSLSPEERSTALAIASERSQATTQADRGAAQKAAGAFSEATVDLLDSAALGLYGTVDELIGHTAAEEARYNRAQIDRQLQGVISGEVDPIKSDTIAGQVALDFVRSAPTMLAALTPAGLTIDYFALKQQSREALQAQGMNARAAEGIATIQAIPKTALFFASSKMVFLGKVPPGFGTNIASTLATEYVANFALNEAGFLSDAGIQSIAAAMTQTVPGVDWKEFGQSFKDRLPQSLAMAIPGALIGTGVASFRDRAAGKRYLQQPEVMADLGFTPEAKEAVMAAPDVEAAETAFKEGFATRNPEPSVPLPQTTIEPLGRRYLVAEGIGEPVEQFQVKRPGEARGVTMTREQITAEGLDAPPATLSDIATVRAFDGSAFQQWARQQKGGFTKTAHDLGLAVRSRREVNALLEGWNDAEAQLAEVSTKGKAGNMEALNEAMLLSTKAQFFREAYEAALGELSAGKRLREIDPNFQPPITRNPDGTYRVQAVDGAPAVTAATPEGAAMVADEQRTQAAQAEATAEPEPRPEYDGRALPPRVTALNKDTNKALRTLFNLEELPKPERERFEQVLDDAKRTDAHKAADEIAADLIATGRVSTAAEHAALVLRSVELQNAYEQKAAEMGDAFAAGDVARAQGLRQVTENLQRQLDTITEASDVTGTAIARALSIRRMRVNRDDYTLAKVVQRARSAKQAELTPDQQTQLKAITDELIAQQQVIAEQKNRLAQQEIELAKAKAETFVSEGRSRRRQAAAGDAAARRKSLKGELAKLGMRLNDITSLVGLSFEQARIVAKIADTYIDEGIASLQELTNKLKADIPDLSDQDIYVAVGRQTKKEAAKIEGEAKRRVRELRAQAALWAKINAALDGKTIDGGPMNKTQRNKVLRETLNQLRRQANRTTFEEAALRRVDAKLAEIQKHLAQGTRPGAPAEVRPQGEKLSAAKQSLSELRQEMGALDTITELERALAEATPKTATEGQPAEVVSPTEQQKRLNTLRERIADLRDQIDQAQVDPAAVNAERLAKLQRLAADLEAQIEGGFRELKPPATGSVPEDVAVEGARRQVRELERLMRTEDAIAALEQQIRTGDFKVSVAEQRVLSNARLEQALIRQKQLRRQADQLIDELRPKGVTDRINEAFQTVRALKTTADMGTIFRQGLLLSASRPVTAARTFVASVRALLNENTADAIDIALKSRPGFLEGERAGLYLSDTGGPVNAREEHFQSNLAERVPGWGRVVKASNRSMVTTLNLLRVAAFDSFVQAHPETTLAQRKAYAQYVNAASGRGNVKWSPSTMKTLNAVFFAPRYAVSRFQALYSPFKNFRDPIVRNAILRDFGALLGTGLSVLGLAALAGAEVSLDPSESDFGKIVIDETRIDIWGGLQQPARLIAQAVLMPAQRAELVDLEKDIDVMDASLRFLSYKFSPAITIPLELAKGENIIGEEKEWWETVGLSVVPLSIQEAADVGLENESILAGAVAGVGAGLGLGIQQHDR